MAVDKICFFFNLRGTKISAMCPDLEVTKIWSFYIFISIWLFHVLMLCYLIFYKIALLWNETLIELFWVGVSNGAILNRVWQFAYVAYVRLSCRLVRIITFIATWLITRFNFSCSLWDFLIFSDLNSTEDEEDLNNKRRHVHAGMFKI